MKNYILAIGIAILIDWVLVPYFIKMMGIYVPVVLISIYYIVSQFAGYIEPLFQKVRTQSVFLILIFMDILQFLVILVYFVNIEVFVYLMMVVLSTQAILFEIYSIKTMDFFEKYREIKISELQSILLFNTTNMTLIGLGISIIYSLFTDNYDMLFIFILSLMLISIYSEIKLYKYVKIIENTNL